MARRRRLLANLEAVEGRGQSKQGKELPVFPQICKIGVVHGLGAETWLDLNRSAQIAQAGLDLPEIYQRCRERIEDVRLVWFDPEPFLEVSAGKREVAGIEGKDPTVVELLGIFRQTLRLGETLVADVKIGIDPRQNLDLVRILPENILKMGFGLFELATIEDFDCLFEDLESDGRGLTVNQFSRQ